MEALEQRHLLAVNIFMVTNTNDMGMGSLRDAIALANTTPNDAMGADEIHFAIPGTGVQLIQPMTPLDPLTEAVVIDGFTQTGSSANTNPVGMGLNAVPTIVLDGSVIPDPNMANGLELQASGITIRGLVIHSFDGMGILANASVNHILSGNFIGTSPDGAMSMPNALGGIVFTDVGASQIGGTIAGDRNLISGNGGSGIVITGSGAIGNTVLGNLLGTAADGATSLGNASQGVMIADMASNNVIGGTVAGASNTIAFNGVAGVTVEGNAVENGILGNSIFDNLGLGIDLLPAAGVNPNDADDPDVGANNLQNFPEFAADAILAGGMLEVTYGVPTNPANATYPLTIQFFLADTMGTAGRTFLASNTYSAADFVMGNKTVMIPAGAATTSDRLVATATDQVGNTSEFSTFAAIMANDVYDAPDNIAQNFTLFRDGTDLVLIDDDTMTELVRTPYAPLMSFTVNGGDNASNRLTVDHGPSAATRIAIPVTFNGGSGAGNDTLVAEGGGMFNLVSHRFDSASSGLIDADGATISYTGLEPVDDNLSVTDRIFAFTGAAETITLSDDGDAGDGESQIMSTLGEIVTFTNPTGSLTIETSLMGGTGADTIEVAGLDSLFNASLIIHGDADDTLSFIGSTNLGTGDLDGNANTIHVNSSVTTSGGMMTLAAQDDVLFAAAGSLSSGGGNISVTADANADANGMGGALSMTDGSSIDAEAGDILLAADENITLGRIITKNNTVTAVTITSTSGEVIDGGDMGGADISASTNGAVVTITAPLGVGASGAFGGIDTDVRNLIVMTTDTDQFLNELDGLDSLELTAGTGNVTLTAGGAIQDGDGSVDISSAAANVTVTAAGDVGSLANKLQTAVSQLSVDTSAAGGSQFIAEMDSLSALHLNAGAGNVTLMAGGAIQDADAAADLVAIMASVTITAAGDFGSLANKIQTSVDQLSVDTSTAGGNQFISETDGLTALNLNAGTGNVTLMAGGAIQDSDASADITATSFTAMITAAGDFGSLADKIQTSVDQLSVDTSAAGGNQFISEADGLSALNLNAGTGNVTLMAGGAIQDADGGTDIAGTALDLVITAAGNLGSLANKIQTSVDQLSVDTSAANGNQFIAETNGLSAINLRAGAGNVTLMAGGAILDTDAATDITATAVDVTITAAGNFGSLANKIQTSVDQLSVDTSAASGNQFISEANGLSALNLNAGTGNVTLMAGGAIQDADGATDISAASADVSLTAAGNVGSAANKLQTAVDQLTIDTSTAGGNQFVSEANGLSALNLNAGTGNVTLMAGGAIQDTDAAIDITAAAADISVTGAGNIGSAANKLQTSVNQLTINTSAFNGSQFISQSNGLTALNLNAGTGNVTLMAGGSIQDGDGAVDVTATSADVMITAAGNFGSLANKIQTSVDQLTIDTSAGGGNQFISEANGLSALNLNAGTGSVTLMAGGAIADADAAVDILALSAMVTAVGGMGSTNPLDTQVSQLELSNTAGGNIRISNNASTPGGLTIVNTGISNTGGGDIEVANTGTSAQGIVIAANVVATGAGADIAITSLSPLTVNPGMMIVAAGNVTLTAVESASPVDLSSNILVGTNAKVQSTSGNVTLSAGDDITLATGSTLTAFGTLSILGDVPMVANGPSADSQGTTITILGTGLIGGGAGVIIAGYVDDDQLDIQGERLGGGVSHTWNLNSGADRIHIVLANGGTISTAPGTSLTINAGTGTDRLEIDTSADTQQRILQMQYDNNDGSGSFTQITGVGAAVPIDANDVQNYVLRGGTAPNNIFAVTGVNSQPNSIVGGPLGSGKQFEIGGYHCWFAMGGLVNDAIDFSQATGDTVIVGSDGDDTLIGGPGNDAIFGGGGMDMLFGNGGNDYLLSDHTLVNGSIVLDIADGDNLNGGPGVDNAVSYGADTISGVEGRIFENGAVKGVLEWLLAHFEGSPDGILAAVAAPGSCLAMLRETIFAPGGGGAGGMPEGPAVTNSANPLDVNADGAVSAVDVAMVVHALNSQGPGHLTAGLADSAGHPFYPDVSCDGMLSAVDAALVVRALNGGTLPVPDSGEGEESLRFLELSTTIEPLTLAAALAASRADLLTGSLDPRDLSLVPRSQSNEANHVDSLPVKTFLADGISSTMTARGTELDAVLSLIAPSVAHGWQDESVPSEGETPDAGFPSSHAD